MDPRREMEAFQRALAKARPIAVRLAIPDMSIVAAEK